MNRRIEVYSDLLLTSGPHEVRVRASGRQIEVSAPSSRVLRSLPGGGRPLSSLRRIAGIMAHTDLSLAILVGKRLVVDVDPAARSGLLARAVRIPGFRLHLWSWLSSP